MKGLISLCPLLVIKNISQFILMNEDMLKKESKQVIIRKILKKFLREK